MSGFLYFVPGSTDPILANVAQLARYPGTTDLQATVGDDTPVESKQLFAGPGGKHGLLFVIDGRGTQCDHRGDAQEWHAVESGDGDEPVYWVGWWNGRKPGPESLARKGAIPGHDLPLADHNLWRVPVVGPAYSRLPRCFRFRKGKPSLEIADQYRELAEQSQAIFEGIFQQGRITDLAAMEWLAKCLGLNYHVGLAEVSLLGVVANDQSGYDAISATVGVLDFLREHEARQKGEANTPPAI